MAQSIAEPSVRLGSATVVGVGTDAVRITQHSDKAVIDWRAFSVDAGSSVVFAQPSASAIALNRVTGTAESRIDGSVLANGQVWLLNPNGVLIGGTGRVNAGGFLATTHGLSNDDFAAGKYGFDAAGTGGGVVNFGQIVSAEGGYAVLAGSKVGNAGLVQARLGEVALGAGKGFVLDMAGDKLLSFAVTQPLSVVPAGGALVENIGVLSAAGGQVLLSAKSAQDVVGGVINTSGLIDATSVYMKAGKIVLDGGDLGTVAVTGGLVASGAGAGQTGGTINVLGHTVVVGDNALLDASGVAGGGQIHVGGGWQGALVDGHASAVRAAVASSATLDASATGSGNGGEITLWSDVNNTGSMTIANGSFFARGGARGGDGGRIETSGRYLVTDGVRGSAAATIGSAGLWLFDPYNVEIVAAGQGGGQDQGGVTLVNGGFESGPQGWTVVNGNAQVVTQATGNDGTVYYSQVSTGGSFALLTAGNAGVLYGYQQTFNGTAGQILSFNALFLAKDYLPYNDSGRVTLTLSGNTTNLYYKDVSQIGNYGTAPWENIRYVLPTTGSYTIAALAANDRDSGLSSQLGFEISAGSSSNNGQFQLASGQQTWTPNGSLSKIDVADINGFLNSGTSVRVTTGTAGVGGEAGNITVNAAISKTTGAATSLQLDALGAITVNQSIGSSLNALNVTLNAAGSGGIALNAAVGTNGGALTLNTPGAVTQSAAFNTNTLSLNGTGGSYTLANPGNVLTTLSANTGSVTLASNAAATHLATVTTSGALSISGFGSLLLDGTVTVGGVSQLKAASSVTIGAAATVAASANVALIAGTNFVNQSGSDAISTTGGARWLIYSTTPASNSFGNLASGNLALWNTSFVGTPPASVSATGNRYIFSTSPTVTLTATSTNKTYGTLLDATSVRPYTSAGIVSAATYGNVFSQDVLSGTPGFSSAGDAARASVAGGPYSISISQGSLALAGYTFAFTSGTLTIDKKALAAAISGTVSKIYDGNATATLAAANYSLTGVVSGDEALVALNNPATGSYDTKNVGTAKAVTVSGLGLTGSAANNYTVNASTSGSIGTIAAKALSAALTGGTTRVYDATTSATLAAGNYTLSGAVAGDAVSLNNPTLGSYDTKNVGTGKTVTASGLALTGADAGNYTVNASAAAAIGSISQKTASVGLTGSVSKIYDGGTSATLAAGNYTLGGIIAGDTATLNNPVTGSYDTRNVGTAKTVTVGGIALTGTDAGNYLIGSVASGSIGTIAAKALSAALTGGTTRVYDATTSATLAAGNYTLSGAVAGDAVSLNNPTLGSYDTKNVGTGKTVTASGLALTGADAGNYTVNASAAAAIGSISQKTASVGLTGSVSKIYDGGTSATLAAGNYTLGGIIAGDTATLNNPVTGSYDTKTVGTAKTVTVGGIALTGADAGNYLIGSVASGSIGTIAAKALSAALTGGTTRVYDATTSATLAAGNYTLSGAVAGDAVSLNNPTLGSYDTKNVGTGKTVTASGLALTGGDAGNYTVNASAAAAIGSISQKTASVGLTGSVSKIYDGGTSATLAAGNYTLGGIIAGDTATLNNPVTGSYDTKTVGTAKTVTVGGIALTGTDAGNYLIGSVASGSIGTIAAKALSAALTGGTTRVYDATTSATLAAGNYTLSGAVAGDAVALNNPTLGSYDTKNVGTGKTVTASGLALTGADAGNYTVNASAAAAIGSISQKTASVGLTGSVSKIYDGGTSATLAAGNYTLGGIIAGDTATLNSPVTGSYDTKTVGTAKTVTVGGIALTGADAGNYLIGSVASGSIGTIAAKALSAALTGGTTRVYDATTSATLAAGNYTLSGAVAGDAVALNNPTLGSYDTKNVGTGKTVTASGLALTGGDAGNYTVNASAAAAIGSITAKAIAAALTGGVTKVYDGGTTATLAAGNYTLTGAVAGDAVTLNNPTSGSYDTRTVGTAKTVSVGGIALTGADAGNYTVNASTSASIGTITAKAIAAALTGGVTKVYDGGTTATLAAGNYTLTGAVAGDAVTLNNPTSGSYDTKNVGTGKTVSVGGIALTGADAGNYTVNASTSASIGTITAKAIAAALTGGVTKVYDGGTTATLAAGNYTLTGAVAGDAVTLNNPTSGSYDTRTVGTAKTVSVGGIALTGADAGNYTVNASTSASIGRIDVKAVTAALTGSVVKIYDGTSTATLAAGNYSLTGTVAGDAVTLNNPVTGSYDSRNVGTARLVSVGGIALTGSDAGNYAVNTQASGSVGRIDAKALAVALTGNVSRIYNGSTAATLAPENYALTGFVAGEAASISQTVGQYATPTAGTGITVSTSLSQAQFSATDGTLLSNYVLPVGGVSGAVGTITPAPPPPPPPPAPTAAPEATPDAAPAPAAVTAPQPVATSSPAPTPEAPSGAPAPGGGSAPAPSGGAAPVEASPPSPVPAEKPPTPKDAADSGDPILATVDGPAGDKPAPNATRQTSDSTPIAGGLLTAQRALPPQSSDVPGLDQGFSGNGNAL